MSKLNITGDLVKDVSRSFYLTLRFLPASVRELISLAYLLARASDTIADTEGLPRHRRGALLSSYHKALLNKSCPPELCREFEVFARELEHRGEKVLLSEMEMLFTALEQLEEAEWNVVRRVLLTICETQQWDLTYFPAGKVTRLEHTNELEGYAYGVAGCVGEFWSETIVLKGLVPAHQRPLLSTLGKRYGTGLQLVNIIRDFEEDWEKGRCYIPGKEAQKEAARAELVVWSQRAAEEVAAGLAYCRALPPGRLKFATLLPALLATKTLKKWDASSPTQRREGVKISRSEVYRSLFVAAIRALI